ncbi:MurR/RpiR family transcriptional regulator [Lactobacillus plantarum] [Lactiplantibacillus mudanjiangensis]|uniref:MurR/RpiR family transcriptional regulator n=1 Tax=Lactiplantibacillus mudanjiangensis TaxID=1296538 RepID=UPI0010155723|nr:MurR/RpiR family transcriptional regulator [Lactobacillus plantarum] [Lactiplantibacillus mudanjiangensis]
MITFEQHVLNAEYKLNETEEAIISYIKANQETVSHMSIGKLATATYVAPNAITRLCKKLSYDGFVALKLALRDTNAIDQWGSEQLLQQAIINRNFDLIDEQREDAVIEAMMIAKKNFFFAVGETAYVAQNFADIFNAADQKTQFVTYENQIIYEIENDSNLTIFCISQSGETAQTLRVAKAARANQQTIISLTGLQANTLSRLADIALYSYAQLKMWRGYNLTDKTPLFIIMKALFDRYFRNYV